MLMINSISVGYWENFLIFIIIHINLSVGYWDYIMVAEYVSQESFCRMAVSKEYTDIVPHKVLSFNNRSSFPRRHHSQASSDLQNLDVLIIKFRTKARALEDAQAYLSTHLKV